ncbi:MAG: hypothetical protein HZA54_11905 [Planctomycetes bacterium]|nr:hypothetical protein [Planctomycetota bacterium]
MRPRFTAAATAAFAALLALFFWLTGPAARPLFADDPPAGGGTQVVESGDAEKPSAAAPIADPRAASDEFIALLAQGKPKTAYKRVWAGAADLLRKQQEVYTNFLAQTKQVFDAHGKPVGSSLMSERKLGADLVQYQYMVKTASAPVSWMLTWYKSGGSWQMIGIQLMYEIKEIMSLGGSAAPPAADLQKIADAFIKDLLGDQVEEAYTAAFAAGTDLLREQEEAQKALANETYKAFGIYGHPTAGALVRSLKATDDLIQLEYCVTCPKHPLIWTFNFYRGADKFQLIGLRFNDQFQDSLAK